MMMRAALEKLEERLVRRGGKQGIRGPCSRTSNLYGVSPQRRVVEFVRTGCRRYLRHSRRMHMVHGRRHRRQRRRNGGVGCGENGRCMTKIGSRPN